MILERCGFRLGVKDVFLNITGGIKPDDTAYRFETLFVQFCHLIRTFL